MSSSKHRKVMIDLGPVGEGEGSAEFDLSSCTNAIIHMTRADAAVALNVRSQSAPEEFGSAASWHDFYIVSISAAGTGTEFLLDFDWTVSMPDDLSMIFPANDGLASATDLIDLRAPRRSRIFVASGSTGLSSLTIEGSRSIA